MFYVMQVFKDDFGNMFQRALRTKPSKSIDKARLLAKKHGKGCFIMTNSHKILEVV